MTSLALATRSVEGPTATSKQAPQGNKMANNSDSLEQTLDQLDAELDQSFEARLRASLEGRERACWSTSCRGW